MFSKESDDDDDAYFGFESILLILVGLIHYTGSTPGGFIGPKNRSVLYMSLPYTAVYTVNKKSK